jgi:hypothetical protein
MGNVHNNTCRVKRKYPRKLYGAWVELQLPERKIILGKLRDINPISLYMYTSQKNRNSLKVGDLLEGKLKIKHQNTSLLVEFLSSVIRVDKHGVALQNTSAT